MVARTPGSLSGPLVLIVVSLASCYVAGYVLEQGMTSVAAIAALTAIGIWSLLLALGATVRVLAIIEQRTAATPRHR